MAKVTISEAAGNYRFDVSEISFDGNGKYHSYKASVLKYGESKQDYVELHGQFKYTFGSETAYDVVRSVTSYRDVEHGKTYLEVTGLDVVRADVESGKTMKAYFEGESYNVVGNSQNNILMTSTRADILNGNDGNDKLYGMAGADKLYGGSGVDVLKGGTGNDYLTGGTQADTFVFIAKDGIDKITDFTASGRTHDIIDLSHYKGVSGFDDLVISRVGKDVHIGLDNGDDIVLLHTSIRDVDQSDFNF